MSAAEERGLTVRPFKLIALLCAFLALALDVAALLSPAWVTSERYSLSLWKECRQLLGGWQCFSPLGSVDPWDHCIADRTDRNSLVPGFPLHINMDWQITTLVLILTAATITLLAFLMSLIAFCLGNYKYYYRIVSILLFAAVVLQICALILYPIKFIDSSPLRSYHEFNWGYGLGWGSAIFMLGAAILYCLRTDAYEDAYY